MAQERISEPTLFVSHLERLRLEWLMRLEHLYKAKGTKGEAEAKRLHDEAFADYFDLKEKWEQS